MTIFSKNVGGHGLFGLPGYAYAREFRKSLHCSTVYLTFAVIEKFISTRKAQKRCCSHL